MAQLLPHIQRLAQWRTSFLTFMMYVFIPLLFKWLLSLSKHWCMFILSPLCLSVCIFVVVSAKRRSSVLQRTRCSSKCPWFVPRRITSPITTCRTLGRAAKRHAIRCRSAATTDPSQCSEQRSFVPVSSTTTVGRVRRAVKVQFSQRKVQKQVKQVFRSCPRMYPVAWLLSLS